MSGERLPPRSGRGCHRARANQGQALAGGREDAASLDRPCARRLRELAVGMEEYSRRGSNQRMRPKGARKPTISNRWFSGNFSPALTEADLSLALANFERAHRLRGTRNIGSFSTIS